MIPEGVLLLVHGGYHGSWCWRFMADSAPLAGIEVKSDDLPFSGWADDVEALRQTIEESGCPLVICGHSYGGRVMSAAVELSRGVEIRHLVYLAAPMIGEEDIELNDGDIAKPRRPFHEMDVEYTRERYYQDCPPGIARWAHSMLRDMVLSSPAGVSPTPRPWLAIPSTYIRCGRDKTIDPARQGRMAKNADTVIDLDTGHSPFLSRPAELAEVLSEIVASSFARR